ncbi:uncharacterized protein [Prorops nasuta]|uniref:uncharacterized protein n=1 Tax=Prorops nasuta TaxID=863751 RepID=UPI0034CF0043
MCARYFLLLKKVSFKCIFLSVILVTTFLILIIFLRSSNLNKENDLYMHDVPSDLYLKVLQSWYNRTNPHSWYNKINISMKDKEFLKELRDVWIDVAYDPSKPYNLQKPEVEDQSMGQAAVIREILKDKRQGFFVECGAYDGETRSNTLFLERFYDWTGLLVEADPINFTKLLQKNRKAFISPTCLSINGRATVAPFLMARNIGRLHSPDNSTESFTNSPDVAHTGVHLDVQCFPLEAYLYALKVNTVHYLSLDIEGYEAEVLENIPFHLIDIQTLSVEHKHSEKGKGYMIDLMRKRGYKVYAYVERDDNLANDIIFVKADL